MIQPQNKKAQSQITSALGFGPKKIAARASLSAIENQSQYHRQDILFLFFLSTSFFENEWQAGRRNF
ncbi:MAG: hypothetical protein MPW14_18465 [Candidatus Manganitrophus sp.]|nr:hypothetical protein [Candidatus Manganitrophus sp.]WDT69305.1 MAG: hypothetical protein MPW17_10935 [Candidatus Manganitrophus sp.]WDT79115.1 MAG: hypothetical protein MPW14_18465 [Candidatus Manganitrophus sp.]